jgi:hypothetical protein
MDRFSSVSGIPVLKMERHTADSEMRRRIPLLIILLPDKVRIVYDTLPL